MNFLKCLHRLRNPFTSLAARLGIAALAEQVAEAKVLAAKQLIGQMKSKGVLSRLQFAEFKVFSQFGDDGIIQYLIYHTDISWEERTFVEFGVENYEEANTRFLLVNDNWRGMIMDGSATNIEHVRTSRLYWRHDLTAVPAFIDAENVNGLLAGHGFSGPLGILSIDVDGNDYWIWKSIVEVDPVIVIVEYNSLFGSTLPVTIPYDPHFVRSLAHFSNLYWGCSLAALERLAEAKGYCLVGVNDAGNNAFFVKQIRLGQLPRLSARAAFVPAKFRESRDEKGNLTFLERRAQLHLLGELPLFHVDRQESISIKELYHEV